MVSLSICFNNSILFVQIRVLKIFLNLSNLWTLLLFCSWVCSNNVQLTKSGRIICAGFYCVLTHSAIELWQVPSEHLHNNLIVMNMTKGQVLWLLFTSEQKKIHIYYDEYNICVFFFFFIMTSAKPTNGQIYNNGRITATEKSMPTAETRNARCHPGRM